MTDNDQPIVCDLTVFSGPARQHIAATVPDTFKIVQQVKELPDGYAFQFPNQPGMFMALATFVEHERQCCPFYHFALESEPGAGPFWLRMTGGEGVKAFIQTAWGDLEDAAATKLIQTGPTNDFNEAITQTAPILAGIMEKAAMPE